MDGHKLAIGFHGMSDDLTDLGIEVLDRFTRQLDHAREASRQPPVFAVSR